MNLTELLTLNDAFAGSRILQAGVRLGIFDALAHGEQTATELAQTLGLDSRATWILCNALVALGLLELAHLSHQPSATTADPPTSSGRAPEIVLDNLQGSLHAISVRAPRTRGHLGALAAMPGEQGGLAAETADSVWAYRNTVAASTWLCRQSAGDFSGKVRFDALLWDTWGKLEESVRSGKAARTPDMFQNDPVETEHFILAMHALVTTRGDGPIMARHPLVMRASTLMDIGTGPGSYPLAFCEANPNLHATLFDLPNTLVVTRKVVDRSSARNRLALVAGDYRTDTLPQGYDVVFLSNIIHGEDEHNNLALMKKIKTALNPGGVVIVKDHILDETATNPADGAIFSVQMLLSTTGRDYTGAEVMDWMAQAGFESAWVEPQEPPLTSQLVIGRAPS